MYSLIFEIPRLIIEKVCPISPVRVTSPFLLLTSCEVSLKSPWFYPSQHNSDTWGEINRLMLEDPWLSWSNVACWKIYRRSWSTANAGILSQVWSLEVIAAAFQNHSQQSWIQGLLKAYTGCFCQFPGNTWSIIHLPSGSYMVCVLCISMYGINDNQWQCITYIGDT